MLTDFILRRAGRNSKWTKVWNAINRVVLNNIRPRITSWLCSILLISLGLVVLYTPVKSSDDQQYLASLLATLPQTFWGFIIITVGLIRLSSLTTRLMGYKLHRLDIARIIAGMISCYIWTQFLIQDPAQGVEKNFETIIYAWIVVIELWNVTIAIVDLD